MTARFEKSGAGTMQAVFGGARYEKNAIAFSREGSRRAFGKGLGLGRNPSAGSSAGLLHDPHGSSPGIQVQTSAQVGALSLDEGISVAAVRCLGPVLSLDEVAQIVALDPEDVCALFPTFGDEDDRSVLRDDVVEFLERSEV